MKTRIPSFKVENDRVVASVSGERFRKQYKTAQNRLDGQIMSDMIPYMPVRSGSLVRNVKARSASIQGSGWVVAATPPYGYVIYHGKVMVDELTGNAWARPGAKKVVSDQDIIFNSPGAQAEWFSAAKRDHIRTWLSLAKRTAGGGSR